MSVQREKVDIDKQNLLKGCLIALGKIWDVCSSCY